MSTTTANYGFVKADPLEQYNVAVVNTNLDSIDAAIDAVSDRVSPLEADSGLLTVAMTNAAVWDHVAGHTLRYRKVGKMVEVIGMVQWKSGVLAASVIGNIPIGFRPAAPEWSTGKAVIAAGSDVVADFILGTNGDINIPNATYYQGAPVVNIIFPIHYFYFI